MNTLLARYTTVVLLVGMTIGWAIARTLGG